MAMPVRGWIALLLEIGFVVVALGVRVALQWRRTGTTGIALRHMGRTRADRCVFTGLVVAAGALAVATAGAIGERAIGGRGTIPVAIVLAGSAVAVVAIAVTFWAQLAMGASWRVGLDRSESTPLVTNGPYRRVRNPIYTGMIAFVAGVCVVLPGLLTASALVATIAAIEGVVRFVEEPFLRASHGAPYERWAARAGRFVPTVGRLRS